MHPIHPWFFPSASAPMTIFCLPFNTHRRWKRIATLAMLFSGAMFSASELYGADTNLPPPPVKLVPTESQAALFRARGVEIILDEDKVPPYVLPDPLVCADGTRVRDATVWTTRRRPELLELFSREVYGRTPGSLPGKIRAEVTSHDRGALGGKAERKQVTVWFTERRDGPRMNLLIYQPPGTPRGNDGWPGFVELNFSGNQAVHSDPGITLPTGWMNRLAVKSEGNLHNRATEASRGVAAARLPVEAIIARGYAITTIYYGDLCQDRREGLADPAGVASLFSPNPGVEERAGDAWGAVGVWAWGLSRALDYMEGDPELDARRVAIVGLSRLGKAALWAGAQDERFALVIAACSGHVGAAISRRSYGETVGSINQSYPYWFAKNLRSYSEKESTLPIDQHELLALIAPRPLYVASATADYWADPKGEFLSLKEAERVYQLFGKKGVGVDKMPPPDQPVSTGSLGYHIRSGKHDLTAYDWTQYMNFADQHLRPAGSRGK